MDAKKDWLYGRGEGKQSSTNRAAIGASRRTSHRNGFWVYSMKSAEEILSRVGQTASRKEIGCTSSELQERSTSSCSNLSTRGSNKVLAVRRWVASRRPL